MTEFFYNFVHEQDTFVITMIFVIGFLVAIGLPYVIHKHGGQF